MVQSGAKYIAIEIGGTKLQIVIGSAFATIEKAYRYQVDKSKGAAGIREQIAAAMAQMPLDQVAAIGVGFGGPVNWQTGEIQLSHQIEGWQSFNVKSWLEELTGKLVFIDNDANVAALGEAVHGSGKGYDHVFYMTIGSGIGGGFILHQQIYHGRLPGEVEVGHLRLNKEGTTLEAACSGWAVNEKIKKYIHAHPESRLALLGKEREVVDASLLGPALDQKDEAAITMIQDVADNLAFALSHVVHLFHPDIIVIGGGLSLLGEYLFLPIRERLPHYIMKAFLPAPVVQAAALGEHVVPIGALELANINYQKQTI